MTITHDAEYSVYNEKDNLIGYFPQEELGKLNLKMPSPIKEIACDLSSANTNCNFVQADWNGMTTSPLNWGYNYSSTPVNLTTHEKFTLMNQLLSILIGFQDNSKLKKLVKDQLTKLIEEHI